MPNFVLKLLTCERLLELQSQQYDSAKVYSLNYRAQEQVRRRRHNLETNLPATNKHELRNFARELDLGEQQNCGVAAERRELGLQSVQPKLGNSLLRSKTELQNPPDYGIALQKCGQVQGRDSRRSSERLLTPRASEP